jgi:hypothetical protein
MIKKIKGLPKSLKILLFIIIIGSGAYVSSWAFGSVVSSGSSSVSSLNKGLIAHWPLDADHFNSANNRVSDTSPYANHGTNNGATLAEDRHGKSGGAMSFSTNSRVNTPIGNNYDVGLNSLSFSMWVKTNTTSGQEMFAAFGTNTDNRRAYFAKYNGKWDMGIRNNAWGSAQHNVTTDWTHIVVVFDGGSNVATMYVNGELSLQKSYSDYNLLANMTIGSYGDASYQFFGSIDDVRLYDRALSLEEIKLLYDSYSPKTTAGSLQKGLVLDMPLTSNWTKSETTGSQIMTDKTPYSNDGQNVGAIISEEGATFNGSSQYISNIDVKNPSILEPAAITVSSWIKMATDASTARHIWFTKWYGYSNEIEATTRIPYLRLNGPGDIRSNTPITLGVWHHFVGTYDPTIGGRVYLDGVLVGTRAPNGQITHSRDFPLNIGRYSGGIYFRGMVKNARIYNRALSEEEVKLLYDRGLSDAGAKAVHSELRESCKAIRDAGEAGGDGLYTIKPALADKPIAVYCDMTSSGGGWTLVYHGLSSSATNVSYTTGNAVEIAPKVEFNEMRIAPVHWPYELIRSTTETATMNQTFSWYYQWLHAQSDSPHPNISFHSAATGAQTVKFSSLGSMMHGYGNNWRRIVPPLYTQPHPSYLYLGLFGSYGISRNDWGYGDYNQFMLNTSPRESGRGLTPIESQEIKVWIR